VFDGSHDPSGWRWRSRPFSRTCSRNAGDARPARRAAGRGRDPPAARGGGGTPPMPRLRRG
jgi:hypothetical protein